jgi:hypothetical protein
MFLLDSSELDAGFSSDGLRVSLHVCSLCTEKSEIHIPSPLCNILLVCVYIFFPILEFELTASSLLGRCSTT